jgi:hypothetical protein
VASWYLWRAAERSKTRISAAPKSNAKAHPRPKTAKRAKIAKRTPAKQTMSGG